MIRAVLFDRDGTLIADRSDGHERIELMPRAREALALLRSRGMQIGVVTNQPGVQKDDLQAIHERIEENIGHIDGWFACTHHPLDACACRKPQPGLIYQAAEAFGVTPRECALIGDIGSDVEAAQTAGAQAVLVPTAVTLREEIARAPIVCSDLLDAAMQVCGTRCGAPVK